MRRNEAPQTPSDNEGSLVSTSEADESRMRAALAPIARMAPSHATMVLDELLRLARSGCGSLAASDRRLLESVLSDPAQSPSRMVARLLDECPRCSDLVIEALRAASADRAVPVALDELGGASAYLTEIAATTGAHDERSIVLVTAEDSPTLYAWADGAWRDLAVLGRLETDHDHFEAVVSADLDRVSYIDLRGGEYVTSDGGSFWRLSDAWTHCLAPSGLTRGGTAAPDEAGRNLPLSETKRGHQSSEPPREALEKADASEER